MIGDAMTWLFTFTNGAHRMWAYGSLAVLLVSSIVARMMRNQSPHVLLCWWHAIAVGTAVLYVALGVEGDVYTVHCIWFNALLAAAHFALARRRALLDGSRLDPSP